ncbi:MAG TPA: DUF6064 family protein, partial [Thermoanaerobaculia bacterium]|nr:DUF6064 family protein [Thermoanaerobaculia bacterium]
MPFSRDQFLTVFAAYNHDIWPMQAVLFFLAIAVIATAVENRRASMMILAALWAWCGIAYHWMEFTRVNPAAWAFGFVFLAGAALLLRQPAEFVDVPPVRLTVGGAFIAYALIVYPLIGGIAGHAYPQSATFGAPCPLTIFTLGILMLLKPPLPWVPALPAIL